MSGDEIKISKADDGEPAPLRWDASDLRASDSRYFTATIHVNRPGDVAWNVVTPLICEAGRRDVTFVGAEETVEAAKLAVARIRDAMAPLLRELAHVFVEKAQEPSVNMALGSGDCLACGAPTSTCYHTPDEIRLVMRTLLRVPRSENEKRR